MYKLHRHSKHSLDIKSPCWIRPDRVDGSMSASNELAKSENAIKFYDSPASNKRTNRDNMVRPSKGSTILETTTINHSDVCSCAFVSEFYLHPKEIIALLTSNKRSN